MSFYTDYAYLPRAVRNSNYILRFVSHFDHYVNSRLVRSVGYNEIVWC